MAQLIQGATKIEAAGHPPKLIEEFIGRVNSQTSELSIARMTSPSGWTEPGQTPEFDEYTVVLRGSLHVKLKDRELDVAAGQAVITHGRRMGAVQHARRPRAPSTSPSACRRSRRRRCIGKPSTCSLPPLSRKGARKGMFRYLCFP